MRISKITATGAICATVQYTTLASALILVFLAITMAVFMRWFVRQPKSARADVVQLIKALRGN